MVAGTPAKERIMRILPHFHRPRAGRPAQRRPAPCMLCLAAPVRAALPLNEIKLPPGFHIELLSDKVPDARGMTFSPGGTLFVGTSATGKVYAISDPLGPRPPVHHCQRPDHAGRRRFPQRRALRFLGFAHCPAGWDRGTPRRPAAAGDGQRPFSERDSPRLEIHRLRTRWLPLRAGRRALQYLRAGREPLRQYHEDAARRLRPAGRGQGVRWQRGIRLESGFR